MTQNKFKLDYFLDYDLWIHAINLANFQINKMDSNKHYNNLNLIYFKKIIDDYETVINNENYFKKRVSNNFLYGLDEEFFTIKYPRPKHYFGIRKYYFFSYPLRITHYSIGLYLLKISQEFISDFIKSNKNIYSFYGGDLKFQDNELVLKSKDIYYLPHYKKYKYLLNKELENPENKIVIRLDIENYFDNLSVKKMLSFLDDYIKHSKKSEFRFNSTTIELINFFYKYLSEDETGIPQSDNDIISSFLGYLYLCFADLLIDDEIGKISNDIISQYKIYRYMDDIFIILEFKGDEIEPKTYSLKIASKIRDLLYNEFDLRINNKTNLLKIEDEEDKEEFINEFKNVSSGYSIKISETETEDDENESKSKNNPQDKLNDIFEELRQLKGLKSDIYLYQKDNPINEEVFKDIYNKNVQNIICKDDNLEELKNIFSDFNFDLVKIRPKEILILVLKDEQIHNDFVEYFVEKDYLTINDVNLIIEYICQSGEEHKLFNKLRTDKNVGSIIELIDESKVNIDKPGYYDLEFLKTELIQEKMSIIKQIELRELNEKKKNFSVALNHLVNELHSICYYYEKEKNDDISEMKYYDSKNVQDLLTEEGVSNKTTIQINNLFDRRNNNGISHSGTDDIMFTGVNKDEYLKYKNNVKKCINKLLN